MTMKTLMIVKEGLTFLPADRKREGCEFVRSIPRSTGSSREEEARNGNRLGDKMLQVLMASDFFLYGFCYGVGTRCHDVNFLDSLIVFQQPLLFCVVSTYTGW